MLSWVVHEKNFIVTRFDTRFSWNYEYQPNNYITNKSLLMLITLNSAFKHISFIRSNAYK